jgi:hypothetical protein
MKTTLNQLAVLFALLTVTQACRIRITPLPPPNDPPSTQTTCQAPPIEQNIIGTWRFESNRSPPGTTRTGTVTFTAQNHIIDPDSLFENRIDLGKIVDKIYNTDETNSSGFGGYTGKVFRVDLMLSTTKAGVIWPCYVASNECNKIVIYQLGSYNHSPKYGFTLTR